MPFYWGARLSRRCSGNKITSNDRALSTLRTRDFRRNARASAAPWLRDALAIVGRSTLLDVIGNQKPRDRSQWTATREHHRTKTPAVPKSNIISDPRVIRFSGRSVTLKKEEPSRFYCQHLHCTGHPGARKICIRNESPLFLPAANQISIDATTYCVLYIDMGEASLIYICRRLLPRVFAPE